MTPLILLQQGVMRYLPWLPPGDGRLCASTWEIKTNIRKHSGYRPLYSENTQHCRKKRIIVFRNTCKVMAK
jgi:hypothetical protein